MNIYWNLTNGIIPIKYSFVETIILQPKIHDPNKKINWTTIVGFLGHFQKYTRKPKVI